MAIFVIAPDKTIYVGDQEKDRLHHSSYLNGGAAIGAGEIQTDKEGKVLRITTRSGHYLPTVENVIESLRVMKEKGFNLENVPLEVWDSNGKSCYPSAAKFLQSRGKIMPSAHSVIISSEMSKRFFMFNFDTVKNTINCKPQRLMLCDRDCLDAASLMLQSLAKRGVSLVGTRLELKNTAYSAVRLFLSKGKNSTRCLVT